MFKIFLRVLYSNYQVHRDFLITLYEIQKILFWDALQRFNYRLESR
jgi:hypothetical protein